MGNDGQVRLYDDVNEWIERVRYDWACSKTEAVNRLLRELRDEPEPSKPEPRVTPVAARPYARRGQPGTEQRLAEIIRRATGR